MSQQPKIKVGAIWEKTTKEGEVFFSGKFGDANLLIFKNKYKKAPNHPDFIMYIQEPAKKEVPYSQENEPQLPFGGSNDEIPF